MNGAEIGKCSCRHIAGLAGTFHTALVASTDGASKIRPSACFPLPPRSLLMCKTRKGTIPVPVFTLSHRVSRSILLLLVANLPQISYIDIVDAMYSRLLIPLYHPQSPTLPQMLRGIAASPTSQRQMGPCHHERRRNGTYVCVTEDHG